jgi:hypothetical protein
MPEHGVAVEVNGHHRCRRHGIVSHARKIREVSNDTDAFVGRIRSAQTKLWVTAALPRLPYEFARRASASSPTGPRARGGTWLLAASLWRAHDIAGEADAILLAQKA